MIWTNKKLLFFTKVNRSNKVYLTIKSLGTEHATFCLLADGPDLNKGLRYKEHQQAYDKSRFTP